MVWFVLHNTSFGSYHQGTNLPSNYSQRLLSFAQMTHGKLGIETLKAAPLTNTGHILRYNIY